MPGPGRGDGGEALPGTSLLSSDPPRPEDPAGDHQGDRDEADDGNPSRGVDVDGAVGAGQQQRQGEDEDEGEVKAAYRA